MSAPVAEQQRGGTAEGDVQLQLRAPRTVRRVQGPGGQAAHSVSAEGRAGGPRHGGGVQQTLRGSE